MHFKGKYNVDFRAVKIADVTLTGTVFNGACFTDIDGSPMAEEDRDWTSRAQQANTIQPHAPESSLPVAVNWLVKDAIGGAHMLGAGDYIVYTDNNEMYAFPQATFDYLFASELQ